LATSFAKTRFDMSVLFVLLNKVCPHHHPKKNRLSPTKPSARPTRLAT
jgi:hypothetical protein